MTKILVIEDTSSVLNTILDVLKSEHYQVFGAHNGLDGVRLAREHIPDVIICDIMMPDIDGYTVFQELRKESVTATIPVIFLTARATRTELRQGMELGANDYITKPFEPIELLRAVKTQLSKQAAIAEKYESSLRTLRKNIAYALPHELKTPLVGIEGYSRLLMMDYDKIGPEKILEYATWMVKANERLQRLIENCLVYAQIELIAADPEQLTGLRNHKIANPAEIITGEAQKLAQEAQREDDLKLELLDAALQISEEDLRKIAGEIINNAFKFSQLGTVVGVTSYSSGGEFILCVGDRGRGMTAEEITSIGGYMQFQRALYEQQGLGLGLTIAKRLVELHGGQMDIKSVPGAVTEITVRFPVMKPEEAAS